MTTTQDELAADIYKASYAHNAYAETPDGAADIAGYLIKRGWSKPRTVPDAHLVQDGNGNWGKEYPENTIIRVPDGGLWVCIEWDALEWEHIGHGSSRLEGPAIILWEPQP